MQLLDYQASQDRADGSKLSGKSGNKFVFVFFTIYLYVHLYFSGVKL